MRAAETSLEAAIPAHEELFTTGAYVGLFRPDETTNPFASTYARKRDAVVAAVAGSDRDVLDIGGGMGRMSVPLSARHFVTLTDISDQMLELARPHASRRLQVRQADARDLPFPDASFDYVLCVDVLPHIPQPSDAIREAHRVLRPGGSLIVDVTNSIPFWTLAYPRYVGRHPGRWLQTWRSGGVLPEWSRRVRHHRRGDLVRWLQAGGFRLGSMQSFGPPVCPKWYLATAVKQSPPSPAEGTSRRP